MTTNHNDSSPQHECRMVQHAFDHSQLQNISFRLGMTCLLQLSQARLSSSNTAKFKNPRTAYTQDPRLLPAKPPHTGCTSGARNPSMQAVELNYCRCWAQPKPRQKEPPHFCCNTSWTSMPTASISQQQQKVFELLTAATALPREGTTAMVPHPTNLANLAATV